MHVSVRVLAALAVGTGLLMALNAAAQQPNDASACVKWEDNPDKGFEACTRAINSGTFKENPLAILFLTRGNIWMNRGDLDKAIADYDAAAAADLQYVSPLINRSTAWIFKGELDKAMADINKAVSMNPKNAFSFNNRARIWLLKGEAGRAVADIDAALRLDPNFVPAYGARGRAKFYRGQFAEAIADLSQFSDRSKNPFGPIWLYMAKTRSNQDGKADLDQAAGMVKPNAWPTPLIQMFQGKLDRQGVMAAMAKSGQAKTDQSCEAEFYLGEQAMMQGRKDEAQQSFKRAVEICPKNFVEYDGAVAELKNLAK